MEFRDYVPIRVLHDFIERIEKLGLAYILTGSMAMIRYTVFRQTADLDIVIEMNSSVRQKFIDTLEPIYYVPHDAVNRAILTNRMFNVIHIETAFKIDLILRKKNAFQKNAFERRELTDYYGRPVKVIGKEDLIISKLLWAKDTGSEIQMRDVRNLMRAGFDLKYCRRWTKVLEITELFEKALNESNR